MAQPIPLREITRNVKQPRATFPEDYIASLAASICKRGLIQPITVRPIPSPGKFKFEIVTGECRFRAHQRIGADTIACEIVSIDDAEMQLRAIVENLQRQDMNPIEEANAFATLVEQGYSMQQIVDELSLKSTAIVRQRMDLLNLTSEIQQLVISGQLPVAMASGVAFASPQNQTRLLREIVAGRLRTAEQVRHAGIAMREAEAQLDGFALAPRASSKDLAVLSRLEGKIDSIAQMVAYGFKDGECVAAQRVSVERVRLMADKLTLIRKHILQMEHDLRRVATQTEILFSERPSQ